MVNNNHFIKIGDVELPEYVSYKRAPLWSIILGYVFALVAGVNGIEGIHGIIMSLMGLLQCGWVYRVVYVIDILLIVGILNWSFTYLFSKTFTSDKYSNGFYEHYKYDKLTRINGLCMLALFLAVAVWRGIQLPW